MTGDDGAACLGAEELRALAEEHDLKFWRAIGSTYADWARVRLGEKRAEAFRAGLAAYADLGVAEAALLPLLADVELVVGRRDEARLSAAPNSAQAPALGMVIAVNRPTISATETGHHRAEAGE